MDARGRGDRREESANYYAANAERLKASSRKYRAEHHEKMKLANAQWRKANPEKMRAYQAKYRAANLERVRKSNRRWSAANPEKVRFKRLRLYAKSPDKARVRGAKYRMTHPASVLARVRARRARKLVAPGAGVTTEQWQHILTYFGGCCAYCICALPLAQDHIDPLVLGGAHDPTNVVPSCQPCNSSKGTRPLLIWLASKPPLAA